jgi:hypothetical protein
MVEEEIFQVNAGTGDLRPRNKMHTHSGTLLKLLPGL